MCRDADGAGTDGGAGALSLCGSMGPADLGDRMSIIAWLVLGLLAGFIASRIVEGTGQGLLVDILLGIVGSVVGGFVFTAFGGMGVTGFNLYSMVVAIIGAIIVLWIYHAIAGRSRTVL